MRGGDGTSTQPQAQQESNGGRLILTTRWGKRKGANQDRKTTKRTAIARGHSNTKRRRQGHRHTMSIAGCYTGRCWDYKSCSRQSPGSARRGLYVNPASSTANVQCRKAQTDVPVREKWKSQPGREDHQAYRYSKGSEATESEDDRANATLCLSQEAIGTAIETTRQVGDRV